MDSYEGYLERKEMGELSLFERFDDWIRGRNNPPSDSESEAYIESLNQKADGTYIPTRFEMVINRINRWYDFKSDSSASEGYYSAIAEGRNPTGNAARYRTFRATVETIAWIPDRISSALQTINNWVYDRLLDLKFNP